MATTTDAPLSSLSDVELLVIDVSGVCKNVSEKVEGILESCIPKDSLPNPLPTSFFVNVASTWRRDFYSYRHGGGGDSHSPPSHEDHEKVLVSTLNKYGVLDKDKKVEDPDAEWIRKIVTTLMKGTAAAPFKDASQGLRKLSNDTRKVAGLSNLPIQVFKDTNKRDNLVFDLLFSHDPEDPSHFPFFKGDTKGHDEIVNGSLQGQIAMVAAHEYELDAAKEHGFRTIFISRIKGEEDPGRFDLFIPFTDTADGGLVTLADRLNA